MKACPLYHSVSHPPRGSMHRFRNSPTRSGFCALTGYISCGAEPLDFTPACVSPPASEREGQLRSPLLAASTKNQPGLAPLLQVTRRSQARCRHRC